MSKNLYIIRHGQTDWNLERRRQGRTDTALNKTGLEQANTMKTKLADILIEVCYTSPLKRAVKTAEIICDGKIPIIHDELLLEKCFGKTEGMVQDNLPYASEFSFGNKYDDNTESWEEVLVRAEKFLAKIRTIDIENILVVSHGVFLKALHFAIIGYDENTDFLSWHLENCEVDKYVI